MSTENRTATLTFMGMVLGITFLVVLVTIGVMYAIGNVIFGDLGMMFWLLTGFLVFVESLVGLLSLNIFLRERCAFRPSGPTLMAVYFLVGVFFLVGLVSIIIYAVVRSQISVTTGPDRIFFAIMALEVMVFFVITGFAYGYDLFFSGRERPIMEAREEHQRKALSVKSAISALDQLKLEDSESRLRVDAIRKRLSTVQQALDHSHGGAGYSYEEGRQGSLAPEDQQRLTDFVGQLEDAAFNLDSSSSEALNSSLDDMEKLAEKLTLVTGKMQLV